MKKEKIIRFIYKLSYIIPISFFIFLIIFGIWNFPKSKMQNSKEYAWLIKKEHLKDTIRYACGKRTYGNKFVKQNYRFKGQDYYVHIFDFFKLRDLDINAIQFINNADLDNISSFIERVDDNSHSDPSRIILGFYLDLAPPIKVSFDWKSKIEKSIKKDDYIAYYGKFNKVLLSNKKNSPEILYNFENKVILKSLFLFLKKRNHFFIIIVSSDYNFIMDDALDLFNL